MSCVLRQFSASCAYDSMFWMVNCVKVSQFQLLNYSLWCVISSYAQNTRESFLLLRKEPWFTYTVFNSFCLSVQQLNILALRSPIPQQTAWYHTWQLLHWIQEAAFFFSWMHFRTFCAQQTSFSFTNLKSGTVSGTLALDPAVKVAQS